MKEITPPLIVELALEALYVDAEEVFAKGRKWEMVAIRQTVLVLLYEYFPRLKIKTAGQLIRRHYTCVPCGRERGKALISVNDPIISPKYRHAKKAIEQWKSPK